jgi:hypothetical protein
MPGEPEREKLIREKVVSEDEAEAAATHDARLIIRELLMERGYLPDEVEVDREFTIAAGGRTENSSVDYIIKLKGRRYMSIKCSMALVSRERHVLAFSRVVDSCQIPYSVITDGMDARLMDTATGKVLAEGLGAIPHRARALADVEEVEFKEFPPAKKERETMILQAFECTGCPRPLD